MNDLRVGSYVSFDKINNYCLYKVLDIDYKNNYILIYNSDLGYTSWERIDYIEKIFNLDIDK